MTNLSMIFNGSDAEFNDYFNMLRKKCIAKGLNPPDYRYWLPIELYFRKESLQTILENTMQYDYIDTNGQGRWGGWRTHAVAFIRNVLLFPLRIFRFYTVPKYKLAKDYDATKSHHCIIIGIKDDKFNPHHGWERR